MSSVISDSVTAQSGLEAGKRIVIKIGSALLVDESRGSVHRAWLDALGADIARCRARGQEVILVSSGAIAVGRRHLDFGHKNLTLGEKQAAAAAGMVRLVHAYQEVLGHHAITVGQILLTLDDSENRRRYINARNTVNTLLGAGAVPLINENDTVATEEIRFGDNDRLAARVAAMISADTLVLLSDIDGLYTADPRKSPDATLVGEVRDLTAKIRAMAGDSGSQHGSGGMVTKLDAAKICMDAGCRMVIADGKAAHPLRRVEDGAPCTWFLPSSTPSSARKRWIVGTLKPVGTLRIDAGVLPALSGGKSLLPSGVTSVEGSFEKGASVRVMAPDGTEVARGLIAYSAAETRKIIGHKTHEFEDLLGYRGRAELIHRDDLAVTLKNMDATP